MLYIMRHGRTEWNDLKKMQGRTDIALNDVGIKQATDAKEEYKDVHFDICYCSPLLRARQTAEILLEGKDVPIVFDDRLKEMSFGVCEGENFLELKNGAASPMKIFFENPELYEAVEGGESFDDLFSRTGEFLNEVIYPELEKGKDIIIVGHGAMNSSILCQVKDIPLNRFWEAGIVNCKLMKLK